MNPDQPVISTPVATPKWKVGLVALLGVVAIGGAFTAGAMSQVLLARSGSPSLFNMTAMALIGVSSSATAVIANGTDNPAAGVVQVSTSAVTSNVTLSTFTVTAKGASEYLQSLTATLGTDRTATSSNPVAMFHTLKLYQGSTLLATGIISGNTVKFSNLNNIALKADAPLNLRVVADINPINGTSFRQGDKMNVSVLSKDVVLQGGTSSCATDPIIVTGSATGNVMTFSVNGFVADAAPVSTASISATGSSSPQTGIFTIRFNVSAFGSDIYFPATANAVNPMKVSDSNGVATTTAAVSITSTASRSAAGNYVVHSGETKSITVTYTKFGQGGYVRAGLSTLDYGTEDAAPRAHSYGFPASYTTNSIFLKN